MAVGVALAIAAASNVACTERTSSPAQPAAGETIDVRNAHAMAYDSAARRMLIFGGADASRVRGDTWTWDGNERRWTLVATRGPAPRTFASMAFDGARVFGDTWEFDGTAWQQLTTIPPQPRVDNGH